MSSHAKFRRGLRLTLTREEKKKLTKRYTEDPEAYQLYLKARHYSAQTNRRGRQEVRGISASGHRPRPRVHASPTLRSPIHTASRRSSTPHRRVQTMPKAKAAAAKALEIDDELAEAHISLGYAELHLRLGLAGGSPITSIGRLP